MTAEASVSDTIMAALVIVLATTCKDWEFQFTKELLDEVMGNYVIFVEHTDCHTVPVGAEGHRVITVRAKRRQVKEST